MYVAIQVTSNNSTVAHEGPFQNCQEDNPPTPVLIDTSTAISLGIKPRQVTDRLPLNAHLRPCLHVHVCDFCIIVIARFHRKKKVMLTSALLHILLSKVSVISMMNGRLLFWSSRGIHHIPYFSIQH